MSIADLVKDEALVADAYERVKADLAGVSPEQLEKVNLDIQTATRTILGALPEIKALRERIVQELPKFAYSAAFDQPFRAHSIRIPGIRSGIGAKRRVRGWSGGGLGLGLGFQTFLAAHG